MKYFSFKNVAYSMTVVSSVLALITSLVLISGKEALGWPYTVGYSIFAIGLLALAGYESIGHMTAMSQRDELSEDKARILEDYSKEKEEILAEYSEEKEEILAENSKLLMRIERRDVAFKALQRNTNEMCQHLHMEEMGISVPQIPLNFRLRETMGCLASCFQEFTGNECSCCIKLFSKERNDGGDRQVITLCRDQDHIDERGQNDGAEAFPVSVKNTAFHLIFHGGRSSFFSNDLSAEPNYDNSRSDHLDRYRSVVVVPIIWASHLFVADGKRNQVGNSVDITADIMGFLCVDSKETDCFDKARDIEFLQRSASSLFYPIIVWDKK